MINIISSNTAKGQLEHLKSILNVSDSLNSSNILICEDRFAMSLEQSILDSMQGGGSFSINVASFSRLLYHLLKNSPPKSYLTKTGSVMAISKIMLESSTDLKCYGSLAKNYSMLSQSVYNVLAQMMSSNISPQDIKGLSNLSSALTLKINDIGYIYSKYQEFKQSATQGLLDASDKMQLLKELIKTSPIIKASSIHIIAFSSFTKQIYEIIGEMFLCAKDVTVYCLDGANPVYQSDCKQTFKRMLDGLSLEYNTFRADENLIEEKAYISNYLFSYTPKSRMHTCVTDKINIFKCHSIKEEVENVANLIIESVRQNGLRYKDIGVITSNLTNCKEIISSIFEKHNIPYFIDEKSTLMDHILSRTIISALKLSIDDCEMSDILTLLYSPFFDVSNEDKLLFENYLVERGVKSNWFLKDKYFQDGNMKEIRDSLLSYFKLNINSMDTLSTYIDQVSILLAKLSTKLLDISNYFEQNGESSSASITLQMEEKITSTLQELNNILGTCFVTDGDFIKILSDGLKTAEVSIVPLYTDCVFVGDFTMSKLSNKHTLFAIGVNNKLVPLHKSDLGLISDKDIDNMTEKGVLLEPKIDIINEREKLNTFLALLSFENKLYISCSNFGQDLEQLAPSEIINTFNAFFKDSSGNNIQKEITSLNQDIENFISINSCQLDSCDSKKEAMLYRVFSKYLSTKKIALACLAENYSKALTHNDASTYITSTLANALVRNGYQQDVNYILQSTSNFSVKSAYENRNTYSVSALERYFSCPYGSFIKNSLYAKDRPVGNIMAFNSGNYIHSALEEFMKVATTLTPITCIPKTQEISTKLRQNPPYCYFDNTPRLSHALNRLDREFQNVAQELVNRNQFCKFESMGQEISFGKGKTLPPIKITADLNLNGLIDYADKYQNYVRVIDYKTGHVTSSEALKNIYMGIKFQPYMYLSAFEENLGLQPAGALYFPIKDSFIDENKNPDSTYSMVGYVLGELDALQAMDNTLSEASSKSKIIKVSRKKDGDVDARSSTLSKENLSGIIKYTKELSKKALLEIKQGNIAPSPSKDACNYCDYKCICNYDKDYYGTRDWDVDVSINTLCNAIKTEEEV